VERRVDGFGQRANGERLRETGHTLEQNVTACEKTDEQAVDHVLLTTDATRHLPRDVLHKSRISSR
jgi:hypothetical protein